MEFFTMVFIISVITLLFCFIDKNKNNKNVKDLPNETSYKSTNSKLNNIYNKSYDNIENAYKESLSIINSYKFTKENNNYEQK